MSSNISPNEISGILKRKGALGGIWRACYCQFKDGTLSVSKNVRQTDIDTRIKITPQTKMALISNEKPCKLLIEDKPRKDFYLASENIDDLIHWLEVMRTSSNTESNVTMDDFEIVSVIGRGYYGKVMLVKEKKTNNFYAMKTIRKDKLLQTKKTETVLRERNIMANANHPFIIALVYAFQTDSKFYFVLEYAPGGELFRLMEETDILIEQAKMYIAEIALALNYLHSIGVVYRDLKPENVLIAADGHIKLTDFGLSKDITEDDAFTFCGTADYVAPEIIRRQKYSYEVDWWSLGILTYELLFGTTPFSSENRNKLFQMILNDNVEFPPEADNATRDFISKLLVKDPKKRAKFSTIEKHPFWGRLKLKDVEELKVKPLYKPTLDSLEKPSNFDREFTQEPALDSVAIPIKDKGEFNGFSFIGGNDSSNDGELESSILALSQTNFMPSILAADPSFDDDMN